METNFVFAKNLPEHCRQHSRGRQVRRSNRSALQQQQHTDCHSLASVRLCVRCATKTATNVNGHNKRGNNHNNCAQVRLRNSNKTYLRAALCVRSSRNSNLSRRRRRRLALAARSSQLAAHCSRQQIKFELRAKLRALCSNITRRQLTHMLRNKCATNFFSDSAGRWRCQSPG